LLDWGEDRLKLAVHCSAGAYIRSLAHDLALALGTVGHLAALRRQCAGPFTLVEAHTLDDIQAAAEHNHFADLLLPPGWGLDLPQLPVGAQVLTRLGHGQTIALDAPGVPGDLAQVRDASGKLAGIAVCRGPATEGFLWKAEKWFNGI
jgi:tRNA pseudouridine55 synthase